MVQSVYVNVSLNACASVCLQGADAVFQDLCRIRPIILILVAQTYEYKLIVLVKLKDWKDGKKEKGMDRTKRSDF